jgi:hypothetical protein
VNQISSNQVFGEFYIAVFGEEAAQKHRLYKNWSVLANIHGEDQGMVNRGMRCRKTFRNRT